MKLPAFQFYPGDWLKDTRPLSLAAKGTWTDILCALWDSQIRGVRTLKPVEWARVIGSTVEQTELIIDELSAQRVAEIVRNSDGTVTVASRRMILDELVRARDRDRKSNDSAKKSEEDYFSTVKTSFPALFRIISELYPAKFRLSSSSSSSSVDTREPKTPTLEEVKTFCSMGGIEPKVGEIWLNEHDSRPRSPNGNFTDKSGSEVFKWQPALRAYAQKWRANQHQRTESIPVWKQIKNLEDELGKHPANHESLSYNPNCSAEQKADYAAKFKKLAELRKQNG